MTEALKDVGPNRADLGFRTRYERSPKLLRDTLSMLCHYVWHKTLRDGEHLWSIPVDQRRDFDCILADAIEELVEKRAALAHLASEHQQLREALQAEWSRHMARNHGSSRVYDARCDRCRSFYKMLTGRADLTPPPSGEAR